MKITTCILFWISVTAYAQQSEPMARQSRLFYGLVLGGNVSKVTVNGSGTDTPKFGFRAGILATYDFSSHFFFQGSLAYVKEIHRANFGIPPMGTVPLEVDLQYSWIEMPLTFNYTYLRSKQTSVFIGAGANPRRLLDYGGSTVDPYNFHSINNVIDWNIFAMIQMGATVETSSRRRMGATACYQVNALQLHHSITLPPGNTSVPVPDAKLNSVNLTFWYAICR